MDARETEQPVPVPSQKLNLTFTQILAVTLSLISIMAVIVGAAVAITKDVSGVEFRMMGEIKDLTTEVRLVSQKFESIEKQIDSMDSKLEILLGKQPQMTTK